MQRLYFQWRYFRRNMPWDTNITPPEVVQLIEREKFPPGRALDLGCGTGTNAIYLAQHGFETIGVDFVPRAIQQARAKADAARVKVEFRCADVLQPGAFAHPFDLILDIGCLHNLDAAAQTRYAANVRQWTHPGSVVLIYAFFPFLRGRRRTGITRAEMEKLFARDFVLVQYADDGKSAWYRWQRIKAEG
jgi:SAM-dependent methyltransferase